MGLLLQGSSSVLVWTAKMCSQSVQGVDLMDTLLSMLKGIITKHYEVQSLNRVTWCKFSFVQKVLLRSII